MGSKLLTIDELSKLTNISKFTLRNWEKRYSFLKTIRTDQDHRLYHPSDVDRLVKIKQLVDSGMRIGTAIEQYPQKLACIENLYHYPNPRTQTGPIDLRLEKLLEKNDFHALLSYFEAQNLEISRICVAKRVGFSNELQVIRSADRRILNSDLMSAYYRCFISSSSSLFNLAPSSVRVCSDIESVISTYQGSSVQKSLSYIYGLGHRSSLTIPIHQKENLVGFLYLNSSQKDYFDFFLSKHKGTLNSLCHYSKKNLFNFKVDFHQKILKKLDLKEICGEEYSKTAFLKLLKYFLDNFDFDRIKYKDNLIKKSFLYIPSFPAFILSHLLSYFKDCDIKFRIDLVPKFNDAIRFEVYLESKEIPFQWCDNLLDENLCEIKSFVADVGARLTRQERFLLLDIPVEYHYEPQRLYSITSD